MANYATLCLKCEKVYFTPWGAKKCPTCGERMYQSRIEESPFKQYNPEKQYQTFASMFNPGAPELENVANAFADDLTKKKAQEEAMAERAKLQKEKDDAISKMLISSGFNFEGYRIIKYSGYISGDDATTIPRVSGILISNHGQNLTNALVKIRIQALKELKEAAYDLGCNAVIGVDFDYLILEPERASLLDAKTTVREDYVVCVTANGNAVVIEKL